MFPSEACLEELPSDGLVDSQLDVESPQGVATLVEVVCQIGADKTEGSAYQDWFHCTPLLAEPLRTDFFSRDLPLKSSKTLKKYLGSNMAMFV